MPAWWGKKSSKNKEQEYPLSNNHRSLSSDDKSNHKKNRSRDTTDNNKKAKSFDEVVFSSRAGGGGGGGNNSNGSSSGFSGFGSDRGHPLPQPSILSPTASMGTVVDQGGNGLGSASASLSSGSSSVSSDDPNIIIDHGQLAFYRGYADTKLSPRSPQPRSPGPGSRVPTASTSPLHPRFNSSCSLDSPNKRLEDGKSECHPLPLPPGSPTSPSTLLNSRNGVTENVHGSLPKWKKGKLLGRGTFGHVYLGFNNESGQMCAIKEVRVVADDQSSKECLKQLNQEINLLSQLSHPNIVQYYGSDLAEDSLSVYLEFVSGGSIHKLLQDYGAFREPVIQNYTRQILSGLAYLHGRKTVHRDIKGANILVDPNGEIKLADFGMAKHMKSCSSMLSFKGSPYWMAPEVVMNTVTNTNGYGLAVDIWSLGCTILEMATSKPPWGQYEGVAAIFKIGNSKDVPEIPDHLSNDAKSFIMLCLQRDPSARPTASKLLEHPFVRDQTTTRGANITVIKEAFPNAFDGSRTTTLLTDIHPKRTLISSWEGDHTTRPLATTTRGPSINPRNNARTNMSLPVSPTSSPLRQYGQEYKMFLSPPHPSYTMMSQNSYMLNDTSVFSSKPNTKNSFDPWYEIPQLPAQTPPNRSPRSRLI